MKSFKEVIDLVNNFIDEVDYDIQIESIVKDAVNHAYLNIKDTVGKEVTSLTVQYNKIISLPNDLNTIIEIVGNDYTLNDRDYSVKADKLIMHTKKYNEINIYYTKKATALFNDNDTINLDDKYIFNIVLYGAYAYALHRKKIELANLLKKDMNELLENNVIPRKLEMASINPEKINKK